MAKKKTTKKSSVKSKPSHEDIAKRAYEIWQEQGCPNGNHEANWIQAEKELTRKG